MITCNKSKSASNETILEGTTTVLVDESLTPIVEDQVQVFESNYKAKIKVQSKSEAEVIQALVLDSSSIAFLARKLNAQELKIFSQKKLVPRITPFAKDAIALISNKTNNDTLVELNDIIAFLKGSSQAKLKGLVFDNPNSSTARHLMELAGLKSMPEKGIFSFKTNEEVIKYIASNKEGNIGVVGANYVLEPSPSTEDALVDINVLAVKEINGTAYYKPTQNNIAEGKYPLARDLYIVNCQGYAGLGMGFASFVAGEIGQRIVLKSGLVPVRVPSRKILVRQNINNDKK